jgi:hypothetical protein
MLIKLERFLIRHRKDFDVESPDDTRIWGIIQKKLPAKVTSGIQLTDKSRLIRIRNIAASAIILFSLGYIANDIINHRNQGRVMTLSSINDELGRREDNYKKLVNFKTEEVRSFSSSGDVVISELFKEIGKLDIIYDQALADLKELGPNEKVINTIFSTYEQKIRLLELIILETNKQYSHENNKKIIL